MKNTPLSEIYHLYTLLAFSLRHNDNGTYLCHGQNDHGSDVKILQNFVLDRPDVEVVFAKAVDMDKIYFNWTVTEWNSEITDYFLSVS